jgi:hypothetical protein
VATSERSRHAIETRWSRTTDPEQRRAATGPARLAAAVKAVVDQAPNLTDEQRNRLRVILTRSPRPGEISLAHLNVLSLASLCESLRAHGLSPHAGRCQPGHLAAV